MEKQTKTYPFGLSRRLFRFNAMMGLALFVIVTLTAVVYFGYAANITNRQDTMSNQATSGTSQHQISFNLSGLNTFATGEVIIIDFPVSFSQGGTWATADFAFTDGVARTIAGVNAGAGVTTVACADGANNLGVAIDTTAIDFRVIPCGPSFTASGTGAFITFTIDGTSPNGTLTNPGSAGSYVINIPDAGGNCSLPGDDCQLAVSIVDASSVNVTAVVSAVCGNSIIEPGETCDDGNTVSGDGCSATCQIEGGGGPPPPPPDTTPPIISNVRATDITDNGAIIRWDTNEASDSLVRYGLTAAYGSTASDAGYLLNHAVTLTGLDDGTTYHYQVCSKDSAGNNACSSDNTFNTLDITPPVITNVQVTNITATGATFTWDTDESATSYVDHGLSAGPPYSDTDGDATMVTSHSVAVTGLTENTTYHYRVRSGDASANESFTTDATFATADGTPPVITNVQVTNITATGASVTWTTNEPATSNVDYDLDGSPYDDTESDATLKVSHNIALTGLTENTTYHYSVRSVDNVGNPASTADATFKTADVTPPTITNVQVTNLTATGATVTWTTNEASDSVVEYGKTVSYGSTKTDAAMVTAHSVALTGLDPQTKYYFRVKSKDASNNQATSAGSDFTTLTPPAPTISNIRETNLTQTGVRILWNTSTPTDSRVDYGLTVAYGSNVSSPTLVTADHLIVLSGLTKGTTYHYKITSKDAYGQSVSSADRTFTTVADTTPPANPTNFTAVKGDQQVQLSWTNPTDADFAGVRIRRKTNTFPTGPTDGTQVYQGTGTSHLDTTVTNGVTYYYGAYAFDDVPNYSSGSMASATPEGAADVTPPGNISNFTATAGDARVTLAWTNPPDADFAGVKILRKALSCPTSRTDGVTAYDGTGTTVLDTGLANGTSYCYRAYSYDAVPNWSSGVEATATPLAPPDVTPPGNVTNVVADPGDTVVQLTWINPTDADFAGVRVVRKVGSPPTGRNDGTVVFDGVADNKLDFGLTNGTTYHYGFFTYDTVPNFSSGFVTSATPESGQQAAPPACIDSDGGKSYQVKGTVTVGAQTFDDSCASPATLLEYFCEASIQQVEQHDCGDGFKCSAGRCVPATYQPTAALCGNGICEANENSLNCVQDCPVAPEAPPIETEGPEVSEPEQLFVSDVHFYATSGNLRLQVADGRINVFPRMSVRIYIPDESIRKPFKNAFVNFAGSSYAMQPTQSYEAQILTPAVAGSYPLSVLVNYEDGTSDTIDVTMGVSALSIVYEVVDGADKPVVGARVTLYQDMGGGSFGVFNATAYGQNNPQVTAEAGTYGFIVPPGTYRLVAQKEGYRDKETLAFPVSDNVVRRDLLLLKKPETAEKIQDVLQQDISATEKAVEVTKAVAAQAAYTTKTVIEDVGETIDNPIVEEQTRTVAAPVAATVAVANVATASATTATAIPYLMYLYSLLAHPLQVIARRRRKQWGTVFNAITQIPVDLAIVRLIDASTGRIIRSAVTDKDGRYMFMAQEGAYKVAVAKAGFVFPTEYLKDVKEGAHFTDLYHGEEIKVSKETAITANIPLDPVEQVKTPRRVVWEGIGRRFQKSVSILAILGMAAAVVITPSPVMVALLFVNILMYAVFKRMAVGRQPKNWGIVRDLDNRRPVRNAIIRVFESKYNKLLETRVTDMRGRYAFLVGNNKYYVTYEKPGYEKQQKGPYDLTEVKKLEQQVIAEDVDLPKSGEDTLPPEVKKESLLVTPDKKAVLKPAPSGPAKKEEKPPAEAAPEAKKLEEAGKASLLVGGASAAAPVKPEAPKKEKPEEEPPAEEKKAEIPWELQILQKKSDDVSKEGVKPEPPTVKKEELAAAEEPVETEAPTAEKGEVVEGKKDKEAAPWAPAEPKPAPAAPKEATEKEETVAGPEAAPSAEPEKPAEDKAKVPWELESLLRGQMDKGTEAAGEVIAEAGLTEPAEPAQPEVKEEPPVEREPYTGEEVPPLAGKTEEIKLIQDAEHAHPEIKLVEEAEQAHPGEKREVQVVPESGAEGSADQADAAPADENAENEPEQAEKPSETA